MDKKRILVCDDAAFMRTIIRNTLEGAGYAVCGEACNGEEAVQKYKELSPDLTTMDITMPEKDGIQAVKEIRAFDSNAKVIMCSAMGQQALVLEAIQAGAKDFLVKPFQADRILETVAKLV